MYETKVIRRVFLLAVFGVSIADQLSKWAAWFWLKDQPPITAGFVEFTFTLNRGNFFGALIGNPGLGLISKLIMYSFIGAFTKMMFRSFSDRKTGALCCGLVFGGAVGNVIDTFTFGGTPDMVRLLNCGVLSNWVFNIADLALWIGALRLLWELSRNPKPKVQ